MQLFEKEKKKYKVMRMRNYDKEVTYEFKSLEGDCRFSFSKKSFSCLSPSPIHPYRFPSFMSFITWLYFFNFMSFLFYCCRIFIDAVLKSLSSFLCFCRFHGSN